MGEPSMPDIVYPGDPRVEEILGGLFTGKTKLKSVRVKRLGQTTEWIFGVTVLMALVTYISVEPFNSIN